MNVNDSSSPARAGLWAGVLVAVLVAAGGFLAISSRPTRWTAKVSIVVLPASSIETGAAANYYDTLSRGQITATIAEIFRLPRFETAAADRVGLTPAERTQVSIAVGVVPNTSLIAVTATAPNPRTAESVADTVVDQASSYLPSLTAPYHVSAVNRASGTATKSTTRDGAFVVVLVVAALAAGIGTQQAVHQLLSLSRSRHHSYRPFDAPAAAVPSEGTNGEAELPLPSRAAPVDQRSPHGKERVAGR